MVTGLLFLVTGWLLFFFMVAPGECGMTCAHLFGNGSLRIRKHADGTVADRGPTLPRMWSMNLTRPFIPA
ncbi:UNVERIFIED_ORG: hypothetical protein J2X79_004228 [Arthrobacter globiformis]|nr:hypothetical protein [Arthrobacter globiformis]